MFFFALFCFSLISVLVAMLGSKVSCFGVIIFLIWVLYAWCLFLVVLCMCSLSKEATDVPKERRHKKGLENTKAWRPARPVQQQTARAGWMLPSHTKNREFARPVQEGLKQNYFWRKSGSCTACAGLARPMQSARTEFHILCFLMLFGSGGALLVFWFGDFT